MALPTLKVMGNPSNTDKLGAKIVTGKFDFASDRMPGQKYFGALKGANISHGTIMLAAGGGVVTGITVTAGGTGYTSAPTVTLTGGGGSNATATAVLTGSAVTSVTVSNGGSNYATAPTVAFSGGGGSGAAATAVVSASTPLIDATAALALPGVLAVVTYVDVPTWSSTILYFGQAVAGVVADDWYTAVRATTLINVQYNVLPFISDPDAAMQPGAVLSGVYATTNLSPATPATMTPARGDVNGTTGFPAATVTLQTNFPWTTTYQHNDLEPRQAVAWWVGDNVYAWCGSQAPFTFKSTMVNALGLPADKVHFYTHGMGGGLGDRLSTSECVPAAILSKKVNGHPVDLIYTRKEQNLMQIRQAQNKGDIKWGAKSDGTIVAASGNWYGVGSGASGCYFGINKTFTIPNLTWNYQSVYTNAPARGAWRCVQDPPGAVLYDSALDKLAAYLNMDPYALRLKNLRAATDPDLDAPYRVWGANGAPACLNQVYTASGYAQKLHAPGAGPARSDGRLHGISITGHLDSHASSNGVTRGAIVTMTTDGTAFIDMGGGRTCFQPSTMCHMTAETLGMTYADVNIGDWGNTDTALDGGSQGGSGFTGGDGSATVAAALDLRNQLWARAVTLSPLSTALAAGVTKATATCTVANGAIVSVTVTNGGFGYNGGISPTIGGVGAAINGAPYVTFSNPYGQTSTQATAVANVVNGVVTSISITNPGNGYGPSGNTPGVVMYVNMTTGGNGYTSAPTVAFSGGGGGSGAAGTANLTNGYVTSVTLTSGGSGYTSAPTITLTGGGYTTAATATALLFPTVSITGFTNNDLDAINSSVYLLSDPTKTITYKSIMSGSVPMAGRGTGWTWALRSHAVGNAPIGTPCNVNGSAASCTELLVDPETGQVEILGHWNAVETGRTVFKHGALGQILGGSELQVYQALFAGDIYDPTTGACISDQYTESKYETCADLIQERFNGYDVETDDAAAAFGARGIAEPCVTNYSSIICAIYNATGKWVDPAQGACSPDKVLKALGLG